MNRIHLVYFLQILKFKTSLFKNIKAAHVEKTLKAAVYLILPENEPIFMKLLDHYVNWRFIFSKSVSENK